MHESCVTVANNSTASKDGPYDRAESPPPRASRAKIEVASVGGEGATA